MSDRATPQPAVDQRPDLKIVSARYERAGSESFERRPFDGPPPLARPSDRLEPWLLETGSPLVAFADAAFQRGMPFQTAVSVTLERQLIGEVLASKGLARLVPDLDETARTATVECELSDGLAAYVRALSSRGRDLERKPPRIVAIPMRLGERLADSAAIVERLEPRLLNSALAWERAAALRGLTMTEWAGLAALGAPR
jgi:hypothetical protein